MVRGVHHHLVAALLQRHCGVDHQPLGAADAEVGVEEGDAQPLRRARGKRAAGTSEGQPQEGDEGCRADRREHRGRHRGQLLRLPEGLRSSPALLCARYSTALPASAPYWGWERSRADLTFISATVLGFPAFSLAGLFWREGP